MIPLIDSAATESNIRREILAESYGVNKLDGDMFPRTYIMTYKINGDTKNWYIN